MGHKDPEEGKAYGRAYYAKHREEKSAYHKERREVENTHRGQRRQVLADEVDALKLAVGCIDCGYNATPKALEWDHLPGSNKQANISRLVRDMVSWDIIMAEIAKCEVVCANCHHIRTWNRNHPDRRVVI